MLAGMFASRVPSGPPPVTVTWNPADKSASITLSGGDTIATKGSGSSNASLRATVGGSSGKVEFAVNVISADNIGASEVLIGLANASAPLNNYIGVDNNGLALDSLDGRVYRNTTPTNVFMPFTSGDRVYVYADFSVNQCRFSIDGVSVSVAFSLPADTYYPAATVTKSSSSADSVELDCSTPSTYGLSNGYSLWA